MKASNARRLSAIVLVGVLCTPAGGEPGAGAAGWEVYYQVTYANGSVRDLNEVPRERAGIRRVVRVSRHEDSFRSYEMLATGPVALAVHGAGRTVKTELRWNGRAWTTRPRPRSKAPAAGATQMSAVMDAERTRVAQILAGLRERLKDCDHAVAEAQRKLAAAKGADGEKPATEGLAKATEQRKVVLEAIRLYELQLKALSNSHGVPEGELKATDAPTGNENTLGLTACIRKARTLPHRVQVWKLPAARGKRTISTAMAHAEAGRGGAFHYVAYADTDGDGLPDRLIARSPLAIAAAPGSWTNWRFTTDEPIVFVGNAWTNPDTSIYFARPPQPFPRNRRRGLSNDVYVSGFFGGLPRRRGGYRPYLTNIRVNVSNPFGPVESPRSRIIVR